LLTTVSFIGPIATVGCAITGPAAWHTLFPVLAQEHIGDQTQVRFILNQNSTYNISIQSHISKSIGNTYCTDQGPHRSHRHSHFPDHSAICLECNCHYYSETGCCHKL